MEERVQVIVTEDDYNPGVNIPEDPRGGQYPGGSLQPEDGGISYVVELGNNVQITGKDCHCSADIFLTLYIK